MHSAVNHIVPAQGVEQPELIPARPITLVGAAHPALADVHETTVRKVPRRDRYRASCTCGWTTLAPNTTQKFAEAAARHHLEREEI